MSTAETVERLLRQSRERHARAKFGMWVFLVTEVLFFAGMFLLYAAYRDRYAADFAIAAQRLHPVEGTANTLILLTSSASIALAVSALRMGHVRHSVRLQGVTLVLGAAFLGVKYWEWSGLIAEGFFPGSTAIAALSHGQILFCSLYFMMTGLHALHVMAGLGVIGTATALTLEGRLGPERFTLLENGGLFWHLVDGIWIYLWPLFYLVA